VDGRDAGQRAGGLVAALLCGDGSQQAGHRGQVGQIHVAVGIGIQRAGGVLPSSAATGTGAGAQAIERFIKILLGEEVIAGDVEVWLLGGRQPVQQPPAGRGVGDEVVDDQ